MQAFELMTEAKYCIMQFVLQFGFIAVLCNYVAVCWLSVQM